MAIWNLVRNEQANRLLQSETATTEGRTVVSNYYERPQ